MTERLVSTVFPRMKHLAIPASALIAATIVTTSAAFAQSAATSGRLDFGHMDLDRYSDAPFGNHQTDLAVGVLTDQGVLMGNDNGTFAADRTLNRAEFVQIAMRLLNDHGTVNKNCFPDVNPDAWYADPVCRAKALGIVRGNARAGVDESLWRFEPARDVQYEEAVKMLVQVYALPIVGDTEGNDWYVPYIKAAGDMGLGIQGLVPGERITRGEMARLTLAFLAESKGQLGEYRDAEDGSSSSSSSSRTSSSSSRSSSRTSSSSSRSSSSSSFSTDPNADTTIRSSFLLLGQVSPVLGAVKVFPNNEAIDADRITVTFSNDSSAIENLKIYESTTGRLLGTATRQSAGVYVANIPEGTISFPRRIDTSVYIRANLRDVESGAVGGQNVRIDHITVEGTGASSNNDYQVSSTETFQTFQVTPAAITRVTATGSYQTAIFAAGDNVILGDFDFDGVSTDSRYTPRVTSLTFTVNASAGVSLSNVALTVPGTGVESPCTVNGSTITCSSIPSSIGTVDDSQRIRLVGDVADNGSSSNPSLQVSLSDPGTPTSAGAVTWTDGTTTYTWLASDTPIARGIRYQ